MTNRYVCDALKEIRANLDNIEKVSTNRSIVISSSTIRALVEETQTMVNRMEAAIQDKNDLDYYKDKASDIKKEIKKLKKERDKLNKELDEEGSTIKSDRIIGSTGFLGC
jgi:peptidoglycan hydrolase CwlO-like protein